MLAGTVLADRFVVLGRADAGGIAVVYEARDKLTGAPIALKVLRHESPEVAKRFQREAQILSELSHPGIVRHVGHGLTGAGNAYLAMEWLVGEDLETRLARRPLTVRATIDLARQVADALSAVHQRGIIHRDVKPKNLFLLAEGGGEEATAVVGRADASSPLGASMPAVKLLDFGVARLTSLTTTVTGVLVGTIGYMAPEQAQCLTEMSGRVDVFALGCVIHACLTGTPPFAGDTPAAVLAKILLEEAPPLRRRRPDAPEALEALVAAMLAKAPGDRPDAATVARALAAIAAGGEGSEHPGPSLGLEEKRYSSVLMVGARGLGIAPSLRELAAEHGGQGTSLLDGTFIATFTTSLPLADAAMSAARCALALRPLLDEQPLALVTGRGEAGEAGHYGEMIDRAAELLGRAAPGRIRLDEITRGLIERSFDVGDDGGPILVGQSDSFLRAGVRGPFVGRERELGSLLAMFDECRADGARVALVTAPAGIGKSRLCAELIRRIEAQGDVQIWIGRGDPMRSGAPYAILSDALRRPMGIGETSDPELRREQIRRRVGRHFAEPEQSRIAEFLGELCGTPFPEVDGTPLHAARQNAQLMGDQVRRAWERWLGAELAGGPILIVLDDLHWGDWPTAKLLDASLRNLAAQPLMVLGLARPEVHDLLPGMWAGRGLDSIHLRELPRGASERLARQLLGQRPLLDTVERIAARSQGNPLYLQEIVRSMAHGTGPAVPESLMAMLDARLARLTAEARQLLRAASVFGDTFWDSGAGALVGDLGTASVAGLLHELTELEWIVPAAESRYPGCRELSFTHNLLRQAAYDSLTERDRRVGHALAAQWLEREGETHPHKLAGAVVGEHYRHGGLPDRALPLFQRAGDEAARLGALAQARRHYVEALALVEQIGSGPAAQRTRADLLLKLAQCSLPSSPPSENLERVETARKLIAELVGEGEPAREDRVRMARAELLRGTVHYVRGRPNEALAEYRRALSVASELGIGELLGMAHYEDLQLLVKGDMRSACDGLGPKLEPLRARGAIYEWVRARSFRAMARAAMGEVGPAREEARAALEEARRHDEPSLLSWCYTSLAILSVLAHDWQATMEETRRSIDHSAPLGDRIYVYLSHSLRAYAEGFLGMPDAARADRETAIEVASRLGGRLVCADWFDAFDAETALNAGRTEEALERASAVAAESSAEGLLLSQAIAERVMGAARCRLGGALPECEGHFATSLKACQAGGLAIEAAWTASLRDECLNGPRPARGDT